MTQLVRLCAAIAASVVVGCHQGTPRSHDAESADRRQEKIILASVQAIEGKIGNISCVGKPEDWDRRYALSKKDGNKIEFIYREAGKFGFKSGRTILPPNNLYEIDDRSYRAAYGSFDIMTSKLNVDYCGLNAPVADEARPISTDEQTQ